MAKIHEDFLKSIFREKNIDIEEPLITMAVSAMSNYAMPNLLQDKDFNLFYSVDFDIVKETDIDEEQAFGLRQHGWILDETEKHIIRKL